MVNVLVVQLVRVFLLIILVRFVQIILTLLVVITLVCLVMLIVLNVITLMVNVQLVMLVFNLLILPAKLVLITPGLMVLDYVHHVIKIVQSATQPMAPVMIVYLDIKSIIILVRFVEKEPIPLEEKMLPASLVILIAVSAIILMEIVNNV